MQTIALAQTGRLSTRLGFGCSSVMGALDRGDSLALLEAAYDAGIRHFDVAPSYGFGEAEACLGEFLARHPDELTVTTKFGIPPAPRNWKSAVRALARPVLKAMPGLKDRLRPAVSEPAAAPDPDRDPPSGEFTVAHAAASLERSRRALGVARIDLLLLHEARAKDLGDGPLFDWLVNMVEAGRIGGFGVGGEARKMPALRAQRPQFCPVLQYDWSVLDAPIPPAGSPGYPERFRIHHRALTDNFRSLHDALRADSPRATRWSDHVGADLRDPQVLGALMLKAALVANPDSVVLFSSKHPGHIRNNVAAAESAAAEEQALRLYALVRAEVAEAAPAVATRQGEEWTSGEPVEGAVR